MTKIQAFIDALNASEIQYCHWKSNFAIADSLAGQTDIDLLIQRQDAERFRMLLAGLGFKPAEMTDGEPFPAVEHFYALDAESGLLAHVHAYYRAITGDSLTKNYRFPLEALLLQHTRMVDGVRLPVKSAELIVFTLRMMLKHTSLVELALLSRYWDTVTAECRWLREPDDLAETLEFLRCYLPAVDPDLFAACVAALEQPAPLARRIRLGRQLRLQLRPYARHSGLRVGVEGLTKFVAMFYRRLTHSRKSMVLRNGGAVIAFVGSEATGKSTLIAEMTRWLGKHFIIDRIHSGKPPSTTLTAAPNVLLPGLRSLFPGARTTRITVPEAEPQAGGKASRSFPLLFGVRSVLLAYDRRALLGRAFRQAANGAIVLSDRYPALNPGAPDSPQLSTLGDPQESAALRDRLAHMEARLYREIPPPDLVIYLTAPLEVTIARNASRNKIEPEEYVRRRHEKSAHLEFGSTPVCQINTDQPFEQTVLAVKQAIWNIL